MVRFLTVFTLLLALALPAAAAERVALVIANGGYKFAPPLTTPGKDAPLVIKELEHTGFKVTLKNDLDLAGMRAALQDFERDLKDNTTISFIYFSGYGLQVDGANYLLPVDANVRDKADVKASGISADAILDMMGKASTGLYVAVFDASRSNPFPAAGDMAAGLAPMQPQPRGGVMFAAAPGALVASSGEPNSVFAKALAGSLFSPGFDMEAIAVLVAKKVKRDTEGAQLPFYAMNISKDFVLITKAGLAGTVAKPGAAELAYLAAGEDVAKLSQVAKDHADSVWGELAAAQVKVAKLKKAAAASTADAAPAPPGDKIIRLTADGSGDFKTLAEAIAAAPAGWRIELADGDYEAGVTIDKPIDIVGTDGNRAARLVASGKPVLHWTAKQGRIENLSIALRGKVEGEQLPAVLVDKGSISLRDNFLTSEGGPAVMALGPKTRLNMANNEVADGQGSGLLFRDGAGGLVENNTFKSNLNAGIEVQAAAPTLKGNTIFANTRAGILVLASAKPLITTNDISENLGVGIEIASRADPMVIENRIVKNKSDGLLVQDQGRGRFEKNDVFDNAQSGFRIGVGGRVVLRKNTLQGNGGHGVVVEAKGGGNFSGNILQGNKAGPWSIAKGAAKVSRKGNSEK